MNQGSHGRRQPSGLVVYPVYSVNFVFLPPLQYAQQYVPQQYQQQFPQYDQAHEEFDQGQFDQSQQAGQFDQFAESFQFDQFDHNGLNDEAGSFEHFAQFGQHNPPSDFKLFVHPIQNEDSRRHSDFGIKRHRTKTYYRSGSLEGEQSASGKQVHAHTQDVQHANGAGNARRKQQHKQQQQQMRNSGGASKQPTNFSHPLLMTQLKGHGGAVLDMDFSPNGRFLATCADDGASSGTSSGSEGNKENTPSKTVGLSRRQKKNYRGRREDSSSPGTTVKKKSVTSGRLTKSLLNHDINKQYAKLCWKGVSGGDMTIIHHLKKHVLNPDDLLWMGYPVESSTYPGHAIVYKPSLDYSKTIHNTHHYNRSKSPMKTAASEQSDQPIMGFDVNAREFVPKVVNYGTTLIKRNSDPDFKAQIPAATSPKKMCANECQAARKCVRCGKEYFVSQDGSYLTTEQCVYHWGKLRTQFDRNSLYECCKGEQNTKGCTTGKLHVWNGLHENCFNPVPGFVKTRPRKTPLPESLGLSVYAIDCEMCYTTQGFELARITVVSSDGRLVYDTYVRPENEVVDYNTRFSGITANEINKQGASKVLREVQNDLMGFIYADTILIGHGVENDLIALKMIHTTIIDTAYVFPHFFGLPYKRSLKSLVKFCLKREIQMEATGHDSFEDARSCLELMLWKLQEDHAQSSVLSANRL